MMATAPHVTSGLGLSGRLIFVDMSVHCRGHSWHEQDTQNCEKQKFLEESKIAAVYMWNTQLQNTAFW